MAVEEPFADHESHAASRLVEKRGEGRPFLEGEMIVNLQPDTADGELAGVTRALNLNPSRAMRSVSARQSYRRARLRHLDSQI